MTLNLNLTLSVADAQVLSDALLKAAADTLSRSIKGVPGLRDTERLRYHKLVAVRAAVESQISAAR